MHVHVHVHVVHVHVHFDVISPPTLPARVSHRQVLVPFLTGKSLEHSMVAAHEACAKQGLPDAPMRSSRRTRADYGIVRSAMHYLLTRVHGLSLAEAKHVSTLLRLQMLRFACNDLAFVSVLGEADLTVLQLASRQLAYKAARLAERFEIVDVAQMASVRRELESLRTAVAQVPHAGITPPPPRLVLDKQSAIRHRLTLTELLGGGSSLLMNSPKSGGDTMVTVESVLHNVDVIGIYFSASWCPPCRKLTPVLASAYARLRGHGYGFEMILASMDQQPPEFDAYRAKMPWPALVLGSPLITTLAQRYSVDGIPKLVLLNADGELVSDDGPEDDSNPPRNHPMSHSRLTTSCYYCSRRRAAAAPACYGLPLEHGRAGADTPYAYAL